MKIKAIDNSNGTHEFHAVDCVHQKNIIGNDQQVQEFDASNKKDLLHQIELWFNVDFASSNGMTPLRNGYCFRSSLGLRVYQQKAVQHRIAPDSLA
jgi:hypothetical protein